MQVNKALHKSYIVVLAGVSKARNTNAWVYFSEVKLLSPPWWKRSNVINLYQVAGWLSQEVLGYQGLSIGLRCAQQSTWQL